jgi:ornithine carbamoyltransferase
MTIRHFLTTQDFSRAELDSLLVLAKQYKREKFGDALKGRAIALVFFNSSMRTRSSFEIGAWQLGGHAVVLQPGRDAWGIEFQPRTVMTGDAEEHVAEVAKVLSRYCDLIGVRAFPKFVDWAADREDPVIKAFAQHATVPVINLETITHPCQELAHIQALQERLGELKGRKYVLTWTYHPKALNTAVANSALLIATRYGMDVTLAVPDARVRARRALHGSRPEERRRERRLAVREPRHRRCLFGRRGGLRQELGRAAVLRPVGQGKADPRPLLPLHGRRAQDGAHEPGRVQPLPAAAPQRQGHGCRHGRAVLPRHRGSREPLHVQKAIMTRMLEWNR